MSEFQAKRHEGYSFRARLEMLDISGGLDYLKYASTCEELSMLKRVEPRNRRKGRIALADANLREIAWLEKRLTGKCPEQL